MSEKTPFLAEAYLHPDNVHVRPSDGVTVIYGPHGSEAPLDGEQQQIIEGIIAGTIRSYDQRLRDWHQSHQGEDLYDGNAL